MKTLQRIPVPIAVLIMVLCILVGIAFGNHHALSDAIKAPEAIMTEVAEMAAQRVGIAKNLLVLASRNEVDAQASAALEAAVASLESASAPTQIADANRSVTAAADAVNVQIQAAASDQDKKLSTGVMDNLGSLAAQLARRANAYNESLEDVRKLYNTLPMRFVIGGLPEVYQ